LPGPTASSSSKESSAKVTSPILHLLLGSRAFHWVSAHAVQPAWNRLTAHAAGLTQLQACPTDAPPKPPRPPSKTTAWMVPAAGVALLLLAAFALFHAARH
jgi:hypothetical protein